MVGNIFVFRECQTIRWWTSSAYGTFKIEIHAQIFLCAPPSIIMNFYCFAVISHGSAFWVHAAITLELEWIKMQIQVVWRSQQCVLWWRFLHGVTDGAVVYSPDFHAGTAGFRSHSVTVWMRMRVVRYMCALSILATIRGCSWSFAQRQHG